MSATLVHRGPDSDGQLLDGPAALASRRLSIIDLETGDQPIANEDGTVHVVQNGELYNYRELRARLERGGHRFATRSDTEVLVHLYEDHGDGLAFASELRALPRGEIDFDALEGFLAFNSIPAPHTIFRDVKKLPPGHLLVWEDGEARVSRFARPAPVRADEVRRDDEDELAEELRGRLRDSVRAHLIADVPVGVLLSGGV